MLKFILAIAKLYKSFSRIFVMVKVTFLGTSAQIPTVRRNHTSMLLNYGGENILVDCGEGTQRQFRKAKLNPCRVTRILITHWHNDHVLGLPGLLSTLALSGYNKKLFIYGPRGIKKHLDDMFAAFPFVINYDFEVKEVSGKFLDEKDFYLEAASMTHGVPCNAYTFVKKGLLRVDKKKLAKSKLPEGPLLQKIKEGKNVTHKGKKYLAKNLTYKEEDKKVSFVLDTSMNDNIVPLVKDSDLLICESCFDEELKEKAAEYKHLTTTQIGNIAKKSKSKKLILAHLSQRYEKDKKKILGEVGKLFKNVTIADDLDGVEA